jgi:hypothetical protein
MLGPYRNLTTLTAATLFLHPNCQVLNHAGKRIFGRPYLDFLSGYSKRKFERFVKFALEISSSGARGDYGGSITLSHAFADRPAMQDTYTRSGLPLVKTSVLALVWKESYLTSSHIRDAAVELAPIFAANSQLRFLLPIRNPLDCAESNIKTGKYRMFPGVTRGASVSDVARAILDEILWYANLSSGHQGRFFHFFEHEIGRDMLERLARFLELPPDESWLSDALTVMRTTPGYEHDGDVLAAYRADVSARFGPFPELERGLLRFCEVPAENREQAEPAASAPA